MKNFPDLNSIKENQSTGLGIAIAAVCGVTGIALLAKRTKNAHRRVALAQNDEQEAHVVKDTVVMFPPHQHANHQGSTPISKSKTPKHDAQHFSETSTLEAELQEYKAKVKSLQMQLEQGNGVRVQLQGALTQLKATLASARNKEEKLATIPTREIEKGDQRVLELQSKLLKVQSSFNNQLATMQHQQLKAQHDYESRLENQRIKLSTAHQLELDAVEARHTEEMKTLEEKWKMQLQSMVRKFHEGSRISGKETKSENVTVSKMERGIDVVTAAAAVSFLFAW